MPARPRHTAGLGVGTRTAWRARRPRELALIWSWLLRSSRPAAWEESLICHLSLRTLQGWRSPTSNLQPPASNLQPLSQLSANRARGIRRGMDVEVEVLRICQDLADR